MRKTVTVSLPSELVDELGRAAKSEGLTRSQIVRESLSDYLWIRRLRAVRRRAVPLARAQGIFTDEDVFERLK